MLDILLDLLQIKSLIHRRSVFKLPLNLNDEEKHGGEFSLHLVVYQGCEVFCLFREQRFFCCQLCIELCFHFLGHIEKEDGDRSFGHENLPFNFDSDELALA